MLTNIGIELPSTCWTSRIVAQRSDVKRRENFPSPWHRRPRGTFLSNLYLDETKHDLTLNRRQLRSQPSCLSIPIRFPSLFRSLVLAFGTRGMAWNLHTWSLKRRVVLQMIGIRRHILYDSDSTRFEVFRFALLSILRLEYRKIVVAPMPLTFSRFYEILSERSTRDVRWVYIYILVRAII